MKVTELFMGREPTVVGNKIGVELEYSREGGDWHMIAEDLHGMWRFDHDGSLGAGGLELVMHEPQSLDTTFKHLKLLENSFKKREAVIRDSVRAGVHVHINVGDMQIKELFNFMVLYMVMEGPLVEWCGDDRVGNLFCLRATDAYALVPMLSSAVRRKDFAQFQDEDFRYGSMNVCSIPRYGSLEFRAMKSTTDFRLIRAWCKMLVRCKNAAQNYANPQEIIEDFSRLGPEAMLDKVFTASSHRLKEGNYGDLMMDGMLAAQDLAYAVEDWDEHLDFKPNKNPFKKTVNIPGGRRGVRLADQVVWDDLEARAARPRPPENPAGEVDLAREEANRLHMEEIERRHREAMEVLRRQADARRNVDGQEEF